MSNERLQWQSMFYRIDKGPDQCRLSAALRIERVESGALEPVFGQYGLQLSLFQTGLGQIPGQSGYPKPMTNRGMDSFLVVEHQRAPNLKLLLACGMFKTPKLISAVTLRQSDQLMLQQVAGLSRSKA